MVMDMKNKVIENVLNEKLIVIVRGVKTEDLIPFADAVYEGGVRLLEITYSATGAIPDEQTASQIKMLKDHFGDKMNIGAGTVIRENQVELTAKAGGEFIISPDTNPDLIKKTNELGLVSIPGALTPTEIQCASVAGADFVKLFPVSTFGPEYIKAVSAPLSHVRLLAVGGVTDENIGEYLKAGACGFGIGSSIVNKKLIDAKDYSAITEIAKKYCDACK
jgi:2-dehydro-3-deoxyphosphogluconate aldolase/(4S)-4-hydroxy-2-oxoglutarate aldolase